MIDFDELRSMVTGTLLLRGDPGVAHAASGANLAVVHDPDAVVVAADETDVAATVRFAAARGVRITVLATGHGLYTPVTSGILLAVSRLNKLRIDPDARVATIGAGVRWKAVLAAAAPFGLVPDCGSSAMVGCIGYVLGGGLGPLSRTLGVGSDFVRSFRVVTGSGAILTASMAENPELFHALRGGKHGLGVVVSMEYELAAIAEIFAGSLFFDAVDAETVLRRWVRWTSTAPDSVSTSAALMRFPPLDAVPEPLRGRTALSLRFAHVGPAGSDAEALEAEGSRLLAALLDGAQPFLGRVAPMPSSAIASIHNDPEEPSPGWVTGVTLREVTEETLDALLDTVGTDAQVPIVAAELRHLGGAIGRTPPGGDAVGGRDAGFVLTVVGVPDPALFAEALPAIGARLRVGLARWTAAEGVPNFTGSWAAAELSAHAHPLAELDRLDRARTQYDSARIFA
ncbi:FAD-binding oxidoreductase [Microbacteriaceae bacterium VKM Ac-2855]|nr:FAD-binding oxidoreductase [Microbacteriaceae bacterium VKM Ac-2855]